MKTILFSLLFAILVLTHFKSNSQNYETYQMIFANDPALFDGFGNNISVYENTLVIAASSDDDLGENSGSVYVFEFNEGNWEQKQKLLQPDGAANDYFGNSISIFGDYLFIGSYYDDNANEDNGSVYVFHNNNGIWEYVQKLESDESSIYDYFGETVYAYEDFVFISSPYSDFGDVDRGVVFVFKRNGTIWEQHQKICPGDISSNEEFGKSISVNGNYMLIGASEDNIDGYSGYKHGSAYVYSYDGEFWNYNTKFTDITPESYGRFGASVCISNNYGLITNTGYRTITVIKFDEGTWSFHQKLDAPEGNYDDHFGRFATNIDDNTIYIGAPYSNTLVSGGGAVAVYTNNQGTFELTGNIENSDISAGDYFGSSFSKHNDKLLIGAGGRYIDDPYIDNVGAVFYIGEALPVEINAHPQNQENVCVGVPINFEIAGNNIAGFQWQVTSNGTDWTNVTDNEDYVGSNTNTLTVNVNQNMDQYQFHCIVSNSLGEQTSDDAVLTIENIPPTITCAENQIIDLEQGETFLYIEGTGLDATADDNCQIAIITNDYTNTESIADATFNPGTYTITWTATDNAGNQAECIIDITVNAFVGIETLENNVIKIYPNPTNKILNLDFENLAIQELVISDITGKKIIERNDIQQNQKIDLSNLENGIYFIKIQHDNQLFTTKIIKE